MTTIPRPVLAVTAMGLVLLAAALVTTVVGVGGPGELMDMDSGREMGVEVVGVEILGGLACGGAFIVGGAILYRRLAHRHS